MSGRKAKQKSKVEQHLLDSRDEGNSNESESERQSIVNGSESDDDAAAGRPAIRARQATVPSRSVGPLRRQSHLRRW